MVVSRAGVERVRSNRALRWAEHRLDHHANGRLGSLALGCVRRYAESSRNSVSALVVNVFLSVVPALLAVYAVAGLSIKHENSLARHLIYHLHLHAPTAVLVARTFGSVASNAAAASVFSLLTFVVFGLPIGKVLQDFYARAWRIRVGSPTDQWRFALWFVILMVLLGLQMSEESLVSATGWELFLPVWFAVLVAFALWTPWFLLHRRVPLRRQLPGALAIAVSSAAMLAASQILLGGWVNDNGRWFGAFGVALALLMFGQVLGTIWLAGAVFSPVYLEWRAGWRRDGVSPFTVGERVFVQAEE
jgi:hypothetical protein